MTYQLIYADPAWSYKNKVANGAAENHYPTTKIEEMKRLPVWEIAAPDAVLAMWYTSTHVEEARELAKAWGFEVRTMKALTWVKLNQLAAEHFDKALREQNIHDFHDLLELLNHQTRMNGGNYTRANSEDLLIAVRGKGLERASLSVKQVIYSCLGEHSAKPAEARFRLEELYGDVSRIELFSRGEAENWHHWGNDCPFPNIVMIPATYQTVQNPRISLVKAQVGHYQAVTPSLPPATPRQHIEVTHAMVQLAGVKPKKPVYPEKKEEYPPLGDAGNCAECGGVGTSGICHTCRELEDDIDWDLMMNNAGK